jgi:hypothetical protein
MEKKGLGHVEVIASFVLFIAGVGFVLYYFMPLISYNSDNSVNVMDGLIEMVQSKISVYSVIVNGGNSNEVIAVRINETGNFSVFDDSGIKESKRIGEIIYIEGNWNDKKKISIVFSEDLPDSSSEIKSAKENSALYKIGAVQKMKVISERKIKEINTSYYENYSSIAEKLELGKMNNFNLIFDINGREINMQKEIPVGLEIGSAEKNVLVLMENGKIGYGKIEVQEW